MLAEEKADLLVDIEANYEHLSPQLKQAARYVLSAPDEIAVYSMREIADRASVKPPTMLRLATKLNYISYNEFRDAFRQRISAPQSGYAARARRLQVHQSKDGKQELVAEMAETEHYNIQKTFEQIDAEDFALAAESMVAAGTVFIVGLRKCFSLATFFHYATRVLLKRSHLITGTGGMFHEEVSQISSKDVVLAIAFEPYTYETVEAVNAAKKAGATIVAVSDSTVSPLATAATYTFIAANRSPSFYRSLSGALLILQALVAALVTELGPAAVDALDGSDQKLRKHNTYWNS